MQINNSEIILFGGFNEGPQSNVYIYKNDDPKADGEFSKATNLSKEDFFESNGVYMEVPEKHWETAGEKERIILGHNSMHLLNTEKKTFKHLITN